MSNADKRPNIVFLLPDQQRHDFLGCYGAPFVRTPNIDGLCTGGTRYTHAYSLHPVCVPARCALLTGMHGMRTGVLENGSFLPADRTDLGMRTWPEILADAGYDTAAVGKMHFYPWDSTHGFAYRDIAEDKRWIHIQDDYATHLRSKGLRKTHGNEHAEYHEHGGAVVSPLSHEDSVDRYVGEAACRYIADREAGRPFALMVGFPSPHCPYDPVLEFAERYAPEDMPPAIEDGHADLPRLHARFIEAHKAPWCDLDYSTLSPKTKAVIRAHYAALVEQIDVEVGRIIDALKVSGEYDNTVIIYASDHGDLLGDHDMVGKSVFYESSIHVPLIVHEPWRTDAAVCDRLVSLHDITATILSYARCERPTACDARPLPGFDAGGADGDGGRNYLVGALSDGWMCFDGRYRLALYGAGEALLFDLDDDPQEVHNLYTLRESAEIRSRLAARLAAEMMDHLAVRNRTLRLPPGLSVSAEFGRRGWRRPTPSSH